MNPMSWRRLVLPLGYWATLIFAIASLGLYWIDGDRVDGALAVAFLALSVALRAFELARSRARS